MKKDSKPGETKFETYSNDYYIKFNDIEVIKRSTMIQYCEEEEEMEASNFTDEKSINEENIKDSEMNWEEEMYEKSMTLDSTMIWEDIYKKHLEKEDESDVIKSSNTVDECDDEAKEWKSLSIAKFINSDDDDAQPAERVVRKIQKKRRRKKITVDQLANFFESLSQSCAIDKASSHNTSMSKDVFHRNRNFTS